MPNARFCACAEGDVSMKMALILTSIVTLLAHAASTRAYDPATHNRISLRSTDSVVSSIDTVLKQDLGLPNGVGTQFLGVSRPRLRAVNELIGDGTEFEDVPSIRGLNHFHNPLIDPWDGA